MRSRMFSFILAAALGLASGAAAAQTKPPIKTGVDATFAPRMAAIFGPASWLPMQPVFATECQATHRILASTFLPLSVGCIMKKAENAKPERKKLCVN
jgi:hypothetical protein